MKDLRAEVLELFAEEAPAVFSCKRWPAGFRMKTPNDKELDAAAHRRWRAAHPELVGRWKKENPERNREHAAKYRAAHRDEINARQRARHRAKVLGALRRSDL